MVFLLFVLTANTFLSTDSVLPDPPLESALATVGTAEILYTHESEVFQDSLFSLLLSGGPMFQVNSMNEMGFLGYGVEVELRRYQKELFSGFFLGGFSNTKFLKQLVYYEQRESISLGFRFGWKQNFHKYGIPFDIEPNCDAGVMIDNYIAEGLKLNPEVFVGFGVRIAIY